MIDNVKLTHFLLRSRRSATLVFFSIFYYSINSSVLQEKISDFLRTGTTAYEMEKCANKFESTQLFSNITYQKKAVKLCEYELLHQAADINLEVQKYRNLSVDSLMNVAQKLFNPNNRSILFYGPDA